MKRKSDNRRNKRYSVEGIHGNVLYSSDLEVLNISIDGAAIETTKRLELNREYTLKIKYNDKFLNLRGRVVWAVLVSKVKKGSDTVIPIYRAGVKFTDTLSEKANILLKFIEENKIKSIENRLGGLRFKIYNAEHVKIDYPHKYKVKKISLSGMLAETEYPLDSESQCDIEMFLQEKVINIKGRVVNCERLDSKGVARYNIGIEFIEMSNNSKNILQDFLNTNTLGDI